MKSITARNLQALEVLLTTGEVAVKRLGALDGGKRLGLWSVAGQTAVATPELVRLWARMPDATETIAAILSLETAIRPRWLNVLAGRVRETGQRQDAVNLCRTIDALGPAAQEVEKRLEATRAGATDFEEIECRLFGLPAHVASSFPKVLRAISETADLVEAQRGSPGTPLPRIDTLNVKRNWRLGRILQRPTVDAKSVDTGYVLSGCIAPLNSKETVKNDDERTGRIRWILSRPWLLLLAQIVFTQEAWQAEHVAGYLSLELDRDALEGYLCPPRIDMVVTMPDGREVTCGTLGQFLLRTLDRLGVMLLAPDEENGALDAKLGPIIQVLVENQVWRFEARGLRGRRPGYMIHEGFSADTYRIFGARHFYRGGSVLTAAIRGAAEEWAEEKITMAAGEAR